MLQKKKICKSCGKEAYIFSKGRCKSCSSKEDNKPIKKRNNKLKKSYISKKKSSQQLEKKALKTERTKEIHLAMYNWWMKWTELHENRCMSCGCKLPLEFHTWMVDHLLEKATYPQFALEECNFYLTCFDHHSAKTSGFPHPTHKAAIKNAKYWLIERNKD